MTPEKRAHFAAHLRQLAQQVEDDEPVSVLVFNFQRVSVGLATGHALFAHPSLGRDALMGAFEMERHAIYTTQFNRTQRGNPDDSH